MKLHLFSVEEQKKKQKQKAEATQEEATVEVSSDREAKVARRREHRE